MRREGLDAGRFISAAWSQKGVLPFAGAYADVDLVIARSRPDIPGFARVHFGSDKRGFICNFVHPVIVTDERMRLGLQGIPQPQPWRKGDPYPGMSDDERDAFKMLFGLRNQLNRGNAEEREEALRGLGDLMRSTVAASTSTTRPTCRRWLPPSPDRSSSLRHKRLSGTWACNHPAGQSLITETAFDRADAIQIGCKNISTPVERHSISRV